MRGAGGGEGLDDITAGGGDILAGKVMVDKEGNPLTGTMANQGAKTAALNCGGSYTIPAGYHNGSGKVTANSLASQTSATAGAGNILSGKTAWANGSKITGTIASQGALTLNPGTTAKTGSVSGKYMTGNITVPAISIAAANIKKGVKITFPDGSSVTGTFEGWVPTAQDLYYNGVNSAGFTITKSGTGTVEFQNTRIYWSSSSLGSVKLVFPSALNVSSYTKLIIEGSIKNRSSSSGIAYFWVDLEGVTGFGDYPEFTSTQTTITLNISQVSTIGAGKGITFANTGGDSWITRVRLA